MTSTAAARHRTSVAMETLDPRATHPPADALIDHLLAAARTRLGMDIAWISTFTDTEQVFDQISGPASAFGLSAGTASPLCDSYCARVIDGRLPNLIRDTSANPITAALDVTHDIGIGSYLGVPIHDPSGAPRGMLCCISRSQAPHLADGDVHTLKLIGQLLDEILTADGPADRRDRQISVRVQAAIDEQHFRIAYQPVIDIASGHLVGVEALTRFRGGPTRPNEWFAEAGSVGLGIDLELATIDVALDALDELEPAQFLAVNVSPQTANDPRLHELLLASDPTRIVLELTEHVAVTRYDVLCEALDELRDAGIRVAVDDAGAGFSSLSHVLEIRPSILKIDRSIVNGLQVDPARQSLVEAILEIATQVDATVVAEGIENRADLDCIGSLGITHAQGYFLGRPGALPVSGYAPSTIVSRRVGRASSMADREEISSRRFELAIQHSPIGMALVTPSGTFLQANPAFADIVGCHRDDLPNIAFTDLLVSDDESGVSKVVHDFLDGARTSFRADRQFRRPDGALRWVDVSVVLVRSDGQPTYFALTLQDITERRTKELALAQQAETDFLTSVPNRSAARKHLEELIEAKHPVAVMYCDVRSFKQINDVYGHQTGDQVLKTVAHRLCGAVRLGDIVSRWGGDEFVIILPDAQLDLLDEIRERIITAVSQPIELQQRVETLVPDITVGLATTDGHSVGDITQLVHRADTDMYHQRSVNLSV